MTLFRKMQRCYFVFSEMAFFYRVGAILFDESMGLLLRWANAVRPYRKGVVAGVKSVGADKNIREVEIECKAVFIHYTGGLYEYF